MPQPQAEERPKYAMRKAVIVRAAVGIINGKGVHGTTFGEIAETLGLVPHAVNYYFKSKEDLAGACFLQAIEVYHALIDRAEQASGPKDRLLELLLAFADFRAAVDEGRLDPIVAFNDVRAIAQAEVDDAYNRLFRRLRRLFAPGPVQSEDDRWRRNARTHLLISQIYWAALWFRQYDPGDYRRMAERLYAVLTMGLAAPGASWRPVDLATPTPKAGDGDIQEVFLRSATLLLNEHGYTRASVARIAERLNLTKGAFYHQIQAKDVLVEQCFNRTLDIMRQTQLAADASTRSGIDNLASLTAAMVQRDVSGDAPLLRTSALTTAPADMRDKVVRRFQQFSSRVASVVSDGIADGSVRSLDANVAAEAITAMVNASAELLRWTPGLAIEQAAEVYARPLFDGLLIQA